jgi:hypothetical protein
LHLALGYVCCNSGVLEPNKGNSWGLGLANCLQRGIEGFLDIIPKLGQDSTHEMLLRGTERPSNVPHTLVHGKCRIHLRIIWFQSQWEKRLEKKAQSQTKEALGSPTQALGLSLIKRNISDREIQLEDNDKLVGESYML